MTLPSTRAMSEEDAELAQRLGQLHYFVAVFSQECMGQLASFGPTSRLSRYGGIPWRVSVTSGITVSVTAARRPWQRESGVRLSLVHAALATAVIDAGCWLPAAAPALHPLFHTKLD
jgi:hypothetical protein